jgi:hypothetical protein
LEQCNIQERLPVMQLLVDLAKVELFPPLNMAAMAVVAQMMSSCSNTHRIRGHGCADHTRVEPGASHSEVVRERGEGAGAQRRMRAGERERERERKAPTRNAFAAMGVQIIHELSQVRATARW